MRVTGCMRGNAPQVVEALWAAKEEPPAKLVGFSFKLSNFGKAISYLYTIMAYSFLSRGNRV